MEETIAVTDETRKKLYRWAGVLAWITIGYNIIEGIVSVMFGMEDETIALFGFGLDSFVEVISGIGILHMVMRLQTNGTESQDHFEQQALKITGTAFYLLAVGLLLTAVINIFQQHRPETTFWGITISLVSIITMWLLILAKVKVGTQLNSKAILADANCTRACMYLSFILLVSSLGYELTSIGWLDSLGALGIAVFAAKEGRESFEKSRGGSCSCSCSGNQTKCST